MGRSKPPARGGQNGAPLQEPPPPQDPNKATPRFCLRHLQSGFDIEALDVQKRADFAVALQKRARMQWRDIILASRHGLGSENMPAKFIKPGIPPQFEDTDTFMVLRYSGKLPMVGVRTLDTFHIVWIEKAFGEVYDHG